MTRWPPIALATLASALAVAPLLALPHPAVMLGLAFLLPAVVLATRIPFFLCLGFVVFSFFRIHEAFPVLMPFRIPQLLAIPTLGVLAWHIIGTRQMKPYWSRELSWFAAFFGLVTVGVVFASNRPIALAYWTATYVKIGIMTLAIAWMTTEATHFARASRILVLAGLAVSYVTLSNKINGIGLVEGTRVTIGREMQSVLGDPNDLSLVLLFPLAFAVSLGTTRGVSLFWRLFGVIALVAIVSAIIATQSRGGLLGIMTVFGLFGLRIVKSKALLISIGGLAMLVLFAVAGISDRASGGAAEDGIDESAMGRIYAWGAAFHMAVERPLTGVGLDNFLSNYFFYSSHWDGLNHAVHSTWFGVLGETGFPGLIVFVGMIATSLRSATKSSLHLDATNAPADARAMGRALVAGLAACCVSGTFLTQGFTWPFYIQIALTAALTRYTEMQTAKTAPQDATEPEGSSEKSL